MRVHCYSAMYNLSERNTYSSSSLRRLGSFMHVPCLKGCCTSVRMRHAAHIKLRDRTQSAFAPRAYPLSDPVCSTLRCERLQIRR